MKSLVLTAIGTLLLLPILIPNRRLKRKVERWASSAFASRAGNVFGEIHRTIFGTNYSKLAPGALAATALVSALCIWLAGLIWYLAAAVGIFASATLYLRSQQIRRLRRSELASAWAGYLDQTRAKMLTTSRSLSYVMFEQDSAASPFLAELMQHGRREFENSGDLEKALHAVWYAGEDEEVTNYVCSALCDSLGSTSSQIENHLSLISTTVRSRNELKQETKSRLAGVRTARAFIVIIPIGMALAGFSFAGSISPFLTPVSIVQMLTALAILTLCWFWSNKLMTFPAWPTPAISKLRPNSRVSQ